MGLPSNLTCSSQPSRHARESALSKKALFTKEPLSLTDRPPPKPRKPPRKRKPRIPTTPAFSFHPSQSKVSSGLVHPAAKLSLTERDVPGVPGISITPAPESPLPFVDLHPGLRRAPVELSNPLSRVGMDARSTSAVTPGPFVDYHRNVSLTYSSTSRDQPTAHAHARSDAFTLPSWLRARQPYSADADESLEKPTKDQMLSSWPMSSEQLAANPYETAGFNLTASDISAVQGSLVFGTPAERISPISNPLNSNKSAIAAGGLPQDTHSSATLHTSGDQVFDLTKFVPEWGPR